MEIVTHGINPHSVNQFTAIYKELDTIACAFYNHLQFAIIPCVQHLLFKRKHC
jgi:hypothetical protein